MPSPSVTSLLSAASGFRPLSASRSVPPPGPASDAVRREGPDPDPVVAAREPLAGGEDRGAVARPGGPGEQRVGAAGDRGHLARRDVHDEHRRAAVEVRLRPPVGGERDAGAVGAPGGLALGRRPGHQRSCLAGLGVDHPQVRVVVVDEADAVVLVRQPVDVAVVGQRRLAGLGLRRAAPAAACPRPSSRRASSTGRPASGRRATTRRRSRRAAGRSAGAPRRRRAGAGTAGRSRAGPWPPSAGRAPPRPAAGGRR